jgi:hypothetical protein
MATTRLGREITGEVTMRDDDDKYEYLSSSVTMRKCYEKYCYTIGKKIKVNNQGTVVSKTVVEDLPDEEDRKEGIPSWTAYRMFWKKHYDHLKVSKPSEDICGFCYKFHNAYKYKGLHWE